MILWIASYPKSGNTWLRSFISTYYFSNKDQFYFNLLKNIKQFPHEKFFSKKIESIENAIESWDKSQENITKHKKITFLKSHSALTKVNNYPFTTNKHSIGAIYIVRDPRNVISSLSNHYELTFDESFKFMTNKRKYLLNKKDMGNFSNFTFLGSWSNHYMSWKKNNLFNTYFIKYEDLENNTFDCFKNIVLFINKIMNYDRKIDTVRVQKIVESINFDKLKMKEDLYGFPEGVESKNNSKINFFYLGKKNKWENILSEKQINLMNKEFGKDIKNLGYAIY